MIARINQKIDRESLRETDGNPSSTKIHTEINVPSKGINKNIYQEYPSVLNAISTENGDKKNLNAVDSMQENNNNVSKNILLINNKAHHQKLPIYIS